MLLFCSMPDHDPIGEEIQELLRQPMPPLVQEFARIHLCQYREEALAAARSWTERQEREAVVAELRVRLRDKLRSLFAWAKETGRM
jgi:hypothetical protein